MGTASSNGQQSRPTSTDVRTAPTRPSPASARKSSEQRNVHTDGLAKFETVRRLGSGFFGEVHLMRRKGSGENGELLAVKTPIINFVSSLQGRVSQVIEDFRKEGEILSRLDHKNILKVIEISVPGKRPFIAMEYLEKDNLLSFVKELKENATLQAQTTGGRKRAGMASGIANGMAYLESKNIVHRDLAARNILVAADHTCKITDFGLTREMMDKVNGIDPNGTAQLIDDSVYAYFYAGGSRSPTLLPFRWTSPEGCRGVFTTKSDVWSFGVVLWEIMSYAEVPYKNLQTHSEVIQFIKSGGRLKKPEGCRDELYRVMLDTWKECPEARPGFAELQTRLERINKTLGAVEFLGILLHSLALADQGHGAINDAT